MLRNHQTMIFTKFASILECVIVSLAFTTLENIWKDYKCEKTSFYFPLLFFNAPILMTGTHMICNKEN